MSFTPAHNNSEDANTRAAASGEIADSDPLLLWEWLFLHVVLIIASYALSLQPQLQSLSWYLIYLISLGLFLLRYGAFFDGLWVALPLLLRSEEHTSELQSLMRISYAVFGLNKKTQFLSTP